MNKLLAYMIAATALFSAGCATQKPVDECCSKPEIVYVDKDVSECTRAVQRVVQTSPCAVCERFPVNARLTSECAGR